MGEEILDFRFWIKGIENRDWVDGLMELIQHFPKLC